MRLRLGGSDRFRERVGEWRDIYTRERETERERERERERGGGGRKNGPQDLKSFDCKLLDDGQEDESDKQSDFRLNTERQSKNIEGD